MASLETQERNALIVDRSRMVMEGAGVPIRRALPSRNIPYGAVDPFLLLDEGRMRVTPGAAGFPVHPHRGFEIVTYSLRGPLGQSQVVDGKEESASVAEGGLLRITAGRGMAHGEGSGRALPPEGLEMHILQLWINLARADKGVDPSYQAIDPAEIPSTSLGKARVRVLIGEGSPTRLRTPAQYFDVDLPAGERVAVPVPVGWQGFVFVVGGDGRFGADGANAETGDLVVLGQGSAFPVLAGDQGTRFVLAAGKPYGEAPRWNGSFVD